MDEIGGIGFADFSSFFDDPAFQTPLLEAPGIDLRGVATKKKKRSFFHRKKSTKKVD